MQHQHIWGDDQNYRYWMKCYIELSYTSWKIVEKTQFVLRVYRADLDPES